MRVGVEEPVDEHLAVVRLDQLARGVPALGQVRRVAHGHAVDEAQHEEALARELVVDRGDGEARVALEHLAEPVDVRGLEAEVELAPERVGQMADHRREVDEPPQASRCSAFSAKSSSRPEVAHDLVLCAVALHLDDDAIAALERRGVHLADRPRGERLGVDAREHVLPGHAELLLHDRDDLFLGHRRHVVLELRELGDELRRQQSGRVERIWPSFANVGPSSSRAARRLFARSSSGTSAAPRSPRP